MKGNSGQNIQLTVRKDPQLFHRLDGVSPVLRRAIGHDDVRHGAAHVGQRRQQLPRRRHRVVHLCSKCSS